MCPNLDRLTLPEMKYARRSSRSPSHGSAGSRNGWSIGIGAPSPATSAGSLPLPVPPSPRTDPGRQARDRPFGHVPALELDRSQTMPDPRPHLPQNLRRFRQTEVSLPARQIAPQFLGDLDTRLRPQLRRVSRRTRTFIFAIDLAAHYRLGTKEVQLRDFGRHQEEGTGGAFCKRRGTSVRPYIPRLNRRRRIPVSENLIL